MKKCSLLHLTIASILFAAWATTSPALASDDYQNELGFLRAKNKEDGGNKVYQTALGFQHYFSPVSTQGKPLNEAAFLNRAGSIGIVIFDHKFDGSFEADTENWGVVTTFAEQESPWTLQASYIKQDGQFSVPTKANITGESFSVGLGYFIAGGLLASGQHSQGRTKTSGFNKLTTTSYQLEIEWLHLMTTKTAFNITATIAKERDKLGTLAEDGTFILVSGDYYFNPKTSAGVLFSNQKHEDKSKEGSSFSITATRFVTQKFSIAAEIIKFNADEDTAEDEKNWVIELAYRF